MAQKNVTPISPAVVLTSITPSITHEWRYDLYLLSVPGQRGRFYRRRSDAERVMRRFERRFPLPPKPEHDGHQIDDLVSIVERIEKKAPQPAPAPAPSPFTDQDRERNARMLVDSWEQGEKWYRAALGGFPDVHTQRAFYEGC